MARAGKLYHTSKSWVIPVACFLGISAVFAASEKLPLPRFASIRSNKVNVHVGPGKSYPIEWTYTRQGLPIEIVAEFDTWRQIKDPDGTVSWVHKSLLSGKRTAIIKQRRRKLRSKPNKDARIIAYLEPGFIAKIKKCEKDWCQLEAKNYSGWMRKKAIWGVYDHEEKV
ncbi:SH3 domain-containing protein [Candidatus Odyssella thessalonicensis]|uniref:SH3 domain-containing protein n=1 Tax=Candidatus Odyssella thessalonicensis TaxID=84647 RepID=UPI000225AC5A|nr:SH3 domain-containing protein [Candidatus Odyssella thessalonicensis]